MKKEKKTRIEGLEELSREQMETIIGGATVYGGSDPVSGGASVKDGDPEPMNPDPDPIDF